MIVLAAGAGLWWRARAGDDGPAPGDRAGFGESTGPVLTPRAGASGPAPVLSAGVDHHLLVSVTRASVPAAARVELWTDVPSKRGSAIPSGARMVRVHEVEAAPRLLEGPRSGWLVVVAHGAEGDRARALLPLPEIRGVTEVALALVPVTERVEGTVRRAGGLPWIGTVYAHPVDGREGHNNRLPGDPAPAEVGEAGTFTLTGLARGKYRLWLEARDGGVRTGPEVWAPSAEPVAIVCSAGERVSGSVRSSVGDEAIAGARVQFRTGSWGDDFPDFPRAVSTGSDGRFAFEDAAGTGALSVSAVGWTSARVESVAPAADSVVRLSGRGRLVGRVTARDGGQPLAGVPVEAELAEWPWTDPAPDHRLTHTDAQGRYALDDVPAGDVRVVVRGKGWWCEQQPEEPMLPDVENVHDLEAVPARTASGRVLGPDGQAVAGASVLVGSYDRAVAAVSASDGSFRLDDLPMAGRLRISATKPGFGPATRVLGSTEEQAADITLRLTVPRFLDVVLVGADGAPPALASIDVAAELPWLIGSSLVRGAVPEADGRCRLGPLPDVDLSARIAAPGCVTVEQRVPGSGKPGGFGSPWTVRLERGFEIRGRVQWDDGAPAEGASVSVARLGPEDPQQSVLSTGDGIFALVGLPAGSHSLQVAGRYGQQWVDKDRFQPVEAGARDVVLTLPRRNPELAAKDDERREMLVRVYDSAGRTVPNALLDIRDMEGHSVHGEYLENGRARVRLNPDAYRLYVGAASDDSGLPLGLGPVVVILPVPPPEDLGVRLPPEKTIDGVVVGADGTPVRGVPLTARDPTTGNVYAHARTDGAGKFKLRGLGDATYDLEVIPPATARPPKDLVAAGGTSGLVVRLLPGIAAWITVLDANGRPLPNAAVRARPEDGDGEAVLHSLTSGSYDAVSTDVRGRARLEHLEPDRALMLAVGPPRHSRDVLPYGPVPWTPSDTTIRLGAPLTVRGRVVDPAGRRLADVEVAASFGDNETRTGTTDADGAFVIEGLPPGSVWLHARLLTAYDRDGRRWASPFGEGGVCQSVSGPAEEVRAGDTGVALTLDPLATLVVRLAGATAVDRGRSVRLTREPESDKWPTQCTTARLDEHGVARFRAVAPDVQYTLWIGGLADDHYVLRRGVVAGAEVLVVAGTRGLATRGTVTAPAGWLESLSVRMMSRGVVLDVPVDADGTFDLGGLPPGRWSLGARHQVWESDIRVDWREVEAGGTVALTLP